MKINSIKKPLSWLLAPTALWMILLLTILSPTVLSAADYQFERNLTYRPDAEESLQKACQVDIAYLPNQTNAPVIVWFHGGGLTGGKRELPKELRAEGIITVGVEYRLSPEVEIDEILDDAAASVAWTFKNISRYGGSPEKIYLAGHSAGGYLVSLITLDKSRLAKYDIDANQLAGVIPYSGHAITHFNTRHRMGMPPWQAIIDKTAPIYHVRPDAPPILIISEDREKELYGRYEESAFFWRMLKLCGHPQVTLYELDGFDHGSMCKPAHELALRFIREQESRKK